MFRKFIFAGTLASAVLLLGCASIPPGAERGPNGTMAYDVLVEASEPGARIEVNGEIIGETPLHLKIFGDPDGTFHDFGSYTYQIHAIPVATNQFAQTRIFQTGHFLSPQDRIPRRIYFDMNRPAPVYAPHPPAYGPPRYYYEPAPYHGPSFRFNFGTGYHHGFGGHHRHYRR